MGNPFPSLPWKPGRWPSSFDVSRGSGELLDVRGTMEKQQIRRDDLRYPPMLMERLGMQAPSPLTAIGSLEILRPQRLGLICSVRCPGGIVIKTFDAVRQLRDAGVVVAGGFHSPMEKDCLDFLLRGEQPVIVCPPKGLARPRLPRLWRAAVDAGRLLVLSPFPLAVTRTTGAQARARNEFLAALSHAVLIPHASPGGKAEAVARRILDRDQPLFTLDDEDTELRKLGAQPYQIDLLLR
jgi:predicted Rossmann fold nucleotide-binding protein DprA/Smf involved in DNA uptake